MPRSTDFVPKYRRHKASGKAVVTIAGRDHYLGAWRSQASRHEYDRLVGEWLAKRRPTRSLTSASDLTVVELCAEPAAQEIRKAHRPLLPRRTRQKAHR